MFPWILYHVNDPLPGFRRWHVKGYTRLARFVAHYIIANSFDWSIKNRYTMFRRYLWDLEAKGTAVVSRA